MAMRKKTRTRKGETQSSNDEGEEVSENETEVSSKLTKKEKRALFEKYAAADKALEAAKAKLAEVTQKRSDVAKEIYESMGKGPFKFNGDTLTITRKGGKNDPDEATYFFRRQRDESVEEI